MIKKILANGYPGRYILYIRTKCVYTKFQADILIQRTYRFKVCVYNAHIETLHNICTKKLTSRESPSHLENSSPGMLNTYVRIP